MAIEFAHMRALGRRKGGNAIRTAAYNMRGAIIDERTGKRHSYRDRDHTLVHHEIMLPADASNGFLDPRRLWNAVEKAERRKDSQVAWELVLALPADSVVSHADRVHLAKAFAQEHFISKGLAVQIDIHGSHSRNPNKINFHGHILITTRRIEGDNLSQRKADDIRPRVRLINGNPLVVDADHWGVLWRNFQDSYFGATGKALRVDPRLPVPEIHLGPTRFQHPLSEKVQRVADIRQENAGLGRGHAPQHVAIPVSHVLAATAKRLTVEGIARELSPTYAAAQEKLRKATASLKYAETAKAVAEHRIQERWNEMGAIRRAAHVRWKPRMGVAHKALHGIIRDPELSGWEAKRGNAIKRIKAGGAEIKHAERDVAIALQAIRPAAEVELKRRKDLVENARLELQNAAQLNTPAAGRVLSPEVRQPRRKHSLSP